MNEECPAMTISHGGRVNGKPKERPKDQEGEAAPHDMKPWWPSTTPVTLSSEVEGEEGETVPDLAEIASDSDTNSYESGGDYAGTSGRKGRRYLQRGVRSRSRARRQQRKGARRVSRSLSSSRSRSPRSGGGEGDEDEGWSRDPTPPTALPFEGQPGMTCPIPTTPLGFFQLFVSFDLLFYLMIETNSYANFMRNDMLKTYNFNWTPCTLTDIAQYLGIVLWMGIIKLPEMRMYWARCKPYSMPAFAMTMSRQKFKALGKYFHFFNRRALPRNTPDKLLLIRPIMEYTHDKCKAMYTPEKHLSLDEGKLKWKGRLNFRTYNPKKPTKYGIKFYFLCESKSGYVLSFDIYRGLYSSLQDTIFKLMGQHLDKGYHVYMDNYHNSVPLVEELYSRGTHVSGTLRVTRRGAPTVL
ncbi:piggyBac transposable element-derived protein 4-like [Palaemon carinicauda]|uniref:piggyBac transposable element-derived protein 4-like n=1 Tax=Palaemon carinicauda TaxID=392227 RepID=UPI0035B6A99F